MRPFLSILLKTVLFLLLTGLLLTLGVLLSLQLPDVQTRLAREGAKWLSDKLGYPVSIEGVSIKWFDSLTLQGVRIQDRQGRAMITVKRLDADYNLRNLIDSSAHNLHLDEVVLYRPDVLMIRNPGNGDTNLEEFIARIQALTTDPNNPGIPNQNVPFTIGRITLAEGSYTFDDPREPYMHKRGEKAHHSFDYNHFTLQNLNADVHNFLLLGDTIALDVSGLSGVDRDSRLRIRQLDTRFLYCNTKMEMAKLYAHIGNSIIRNELTFFYDRPSAFGHFNSRVLMQARFRNSEVRSKDLGYFSDYLRELDETWLLTGNFTGTVNDFRLRNTELRFGTNGRSTLTGDLAFKGLPDLDHVKVDFAFTPSVVNMADIRQYYPDTAFNQTVQKLGTVAFDATFTGPFDAFSTKGNFRTAIGNVTGNLALKLADGSEPITYAATLRGDNFDLGRLIDRPAQIGKLTGEGRITGRGSNLARASIDASAQLDQFSWQGYNYRNAVVRGNLQNAFFHGQVRLSDPNLDVALDGEFDLNGPRNRYSLHGSVERADLRALGYLRDSLVIQTQLDVQAEGSKLDDITGSAAFNRATISLNRRRLPIGTLTLQSTLEPRTGATPDSVGAQRYFDLDSDFLTARLQGTFQPQRTIDDLTRLAREYQLYFAGDAAGMRAYYEQKRRRADTTINGALRYRIDYQFVAKDPQPLLSFLSSNVYVAPATRVEGRFMMNNTSFLTATAKTDSLRFGTVGVGPTELDLTTSKFIYNQDVLASAIVSSQRQTISSAIPTRNLQAEASWDVDHINFTSTVEQAGGGGQRSVNSARLNGELHFKGDAIDLTFRQSNLRVLDGDWQLNPESLIRKVGDDYTIRNLSVQSQNQRVLASGTLSPDSAQRLTIEARNFLLESLNPVLNTSLGGTVNGNLSVRKVYETPIIESEASVSGLSYQKVLIGDLRAGASGISLPSDSTSTLG